MKKKHTEKKTNIIPKIIMVVCLVLSAFFVGNLSAKWQNPKESPVSPSAVATGYETPDAALVAPDIADSDHVRGNPTARIVLIEYSDLECPYCRDFHEVAVQALASYPNDLRWIYRHYPLYLLHENALAEAEASECAAELGGEEVFWKFIDTVYARTTSNGTGFALDALAPLASELGVDTTAFQQCMDRGSYKEAIEKQELMGQREGVTGTPGIILLDTKTGKNFLFDGSMTVGKLKYFIDMLLAD